MPGRAGPSPIRGGGAPGAQPPPSPDGGTTSRLKGTSPLPVAAVIATAQEDDPGGTPCSAVSVSVVAAPVSICGGSKLACTPAGWPVNSNWMVPESTDAGVVWT